MSAEVERRILVLLAREADHVARGLRDRADALAWLEAVLDGAIGDREALEEAFDAMMHPVRRNLAAERRERRAEAEAWVREQLEAERAREARRSTPGAARGIDRPRTLPRPRARRLAAARTASRGGDGGDDDCGEPAPARLRALLRRFAGRWGAGP